jgi:hypothetical protein
LEGEPIGTAAVLVFLAYSVFNVLVELWPFGNIPKYVRPAAPAGPQGVIGRRTELNARKTGRFLIEFP